MREDTALDEYAEGCSFLYTSCDRNCNPVRFNRACAVLRHAQLCSYTGNRLRSNPAVQQMSFSGNDSLLLVQRRCTKLMAKMRFCGSQCHVSNLPIL